MPRYASRWVVLALLSTCISSPIFAQCGVERWSVKTGTDPDAGLVNLSSSTSTTIATMRSWTAPNPIPANNRVSPYETTQWVLNATLTQYKLESDSDYHLILSDSSGNTMIAEIPSPSCVGAGSPFGPGITNSRNEFNSRYTATGSFQTANIPVQIKGVGMFDFLHGQTGVAPNGIEIHPVLDIIFNPSAADFSMSASPASLTVVQGGGGTSTISTTISGLFNSAISLSASGVPAGTTASFNPTSIAAPGSGSSTMTLNVGATTAAGTYSITVTGTGGSTTHTTTVSLTVTAGGGGGALTNGGFESGNFSSWTTTGTAAVNGTAKHSGSWGAQLGSTSPTTDSTAVQTFTLPSSASQLTFWYANTCPDTLTYDWATATLKDNVTGTTATLLAKTCTATAVWTQVTYGAASNAGHSVTLTLANHDDNYAGDATYTYFDDVQVTTGTADTTPPSTSVTAPANGATVNGTVSVTATASDNVGVTKMEIYIDGSLATSNTNATSLTYSWNTTTVANGSHTIQSKAYDAAGNVGSSSTITVTVSNAAAQQLLGNPGFESGNVTWTTSTGVITNSTSQAAHSGTWKAWLDGYGVATTDTILQQVTIPATSTSATLTFWLHIDTAETTTTTVYDTLKLQIRNSSGTVLATLAAYSNLNAATGYVQKSFNLNSYIGQTIQVYLIGVEDSSYQTSFVLDDFALNVQ